MCTNNKEKKEQSTEKEVVTTYQHRCGYCGSTAPLITYEQMYGPGAVGHDCCPDCGGV
jgi:hypothetical protein